MTKNGLQSLSLADAPLTLPGLIVTPAWLLENLGHPTLQLLDVRSRSAYEEGHLPQAVQVDLPSLACEIDGVPGMVLPPAAFSAQMSQLGVDASKIVVLYDDNWGMPAARVLWALARYGHTQTAVLTGGWDRWQEAEYPISTTAYTPPPADFYARLDDAPIAERTWLLAQLNRPDLLLIDTRTPGEFAQGHLPGAICWDWMNATAAGSWDLMRPGEELRAELATIGATPDKEIVTYCRSGARAAHTYLVLRSLGFARVRNYDGSWLEWSHYLTKEQQVSKTQGGM